MASGGKRGGGDRILESRHLVGLFLGVVLLCGVFFTLGYVMGHNQYGGAVHAESPVRTSSSASAKSADSNSSDPAAAPSAASNGGWDFYDNKKPANHVGPSAAAQSEAEDVPAPVVRTEPAVTPVRVHTDARAPKIAKGAFVLQVAALRHQSDALAMADLLQKKRFPSFVAAPGAGSPLYRVQVGPYSDERAADSAKAALDHAGFKAIIKR